MGNFEDIVAAILAQQFQPTQVEVDEMHTPGQRNMLEGMALALQSGAGERFGGGSDRWSSYAKGDSIFGG